MRVAAQFKRSRWMRCFCIDRPTGRQSKRNTYIIFLLPVAFDAHACFVRLIIFFIILIHFCRHQLHHHFYLPRWRHPASERLFIKTTYAIVRFEQTKAWLILHRCYHQSMRLIVVILKQNDNGRLIDSQSNFDSFTS